MSVCFAVGVSGLEGSLADGVGFGVGGCSSFKEAEAFGFQGVSRSAKSDKRLGYIDHSIFSRSKCHRLLPTDQYQVAL